VDKSKRQTKFEHLVAKEMQPFTRCPGQGKPGIVSFSLSLSLGTGNFVVWWDFLFLFVLMHLIRQLAETMSV
jgi:hypothetical protein